MAGFGLYKIGVMGYSCRSGQFDRPSAKRTLRRIPPQTERRDAHESIPAATQLLLVSPKPTGSQIPVYRADLSLYAHVSEKRFERLQSVGLIARIVRSRKGDIKRAILFALPGEPKETSARTYLGKPYSYREHLDSGLRCWRLKRLDWKDEDGVVIDTRGVFLRVVQECTAR